MDTQVRGYRRFQQAQQGQGFPSEYDLSSDLLIDPVLRTLKPFSRYTFDLSSNNPLTGTVVPLQVQGYGFVIFGFTTGGNLVANTAYMDIGVNANEPDQRFPALHARGYGGAFNGLFLQWAAQANTSCSLLVFKSNRFPPWTSPQ